MTEQRVARKLLELDFRTLVVQLILDGKAEEALQLLAKHYSVNLPKIKVGLPRRHRRNTLGCYMTKNETISVLDSDTLKEPSVILHEFYHHLRSSPEGKKHKGTERHANRFAKKFIDTYKVAMIKTGENTCFSND